LRELILSLLSWSVINRNFYFLLGKSSLDLTYILLFVSEVEGIVFNLRFPEVRLVAGDTHAIPYGHCSILEYIAALARLRLLLLLRIGCLFILSLGV
jgi:hypothetical protein